jgi:hypothetical protein
MGGKPSFYQQSDVPTTDKKFRPTDEHLIAKNKEEVVKDIHGDKLEPDKNQSADSKDAERGSAP